MDTLIAILVFAGLAGVVWLFTSIKDKAIDTAVGAANRRLQSRTHNEGLDYADTPYFYALDRPSEEIIEALHQGVNAGDHAPLAVPATYVVARETERITWACANKVQRLWTASGLIVTANSHHGDQRGVMLVFSDTTTVDGVVAQVRAMRVLKNEVHAALRSLDADVEETILEFE